MSFDEISESDWDCERASRTSDSRESTEAEEAAEDEASTKTLSKRLVKDKPDPIEDECWGEC